MENQEVSIEMWNSNKHRRRINSALGGWSSKLDSIRRKRRANVFMKTRKLKEEAELVSWQLKSKGLGQPGQKKKNEGKKYVKQDEIVKIPVEEYDKLSDLYKCIEVSSYRNKCEKL